MKRLSTIFFFFAKPCLVILFFYVPLCAVLASEERQPLLPAPQQIEYGEGILSVSELSIGFEHSPSNADLFAAREIARIVQEKCGVKLNLLEQQQSKANLIFNRLGDASATPLLDEDVGPNSREAYRIEINQQKIVITANSSTGLFYAVQTLRQLLAGEDSNAYFPVVMINDWPSLAYRGFMMDMTHMQFPTIDEIKRQLDFLAMWKTNQYYFYSEANIALEGYPLLIPNARFTKPQIQEIIAYAKERHIDVVPNVNLYGHLHDFFKYEHYADLAITPYGREFSSTNPRVEAIVADWIDQLSAMFSSPFFHIGFDETALVWKEAGRIGRSSAEIYLDMLNRTVDLVESKGKKPMLYADMLQHHPEIIPKIPKDIIAVAWHYIPFADKKYEEFLGPFQQNNIPFFIQSATYNYRWLYPATNVSFANHVKLIEQGQKYGAKGFVNSGWTDDSQVLMRSSRPDMAYGAALSWNDQIFADSSFWNAYTKILYPSSFSKKVMDAHIALAKSHLLTRSVFKYTSVAIWENPFSEESLELIKTNRDILKEARISAERAQIYLRHALTYGVDSETLFAMLVAAKQIDMLTMKYLFAGRILDIHQEYRFDRDPKEFAQVLAEATAYYSSLTTDMFDVIVETKDMFREAWLNEYTAYRLAIPMSKFDRELDFWFKVKKRLKTLSTYEGELPPLYELLDIG